MAIAQLALEPLISAKEVAAIFGLSVEWIYDRAGSGELPSYKLGRNRKFRASEVEEFLRRHRQGR